MQLKQYIKMAFQNLILPAVYRLHAGGEISPGLVVFADAHHDRRPDNLALLVRACKREPDLTVKELYLDYRRNPPIRVLRAMLDFMRLYARAEYVVICDNFLPAASCKKRRETRVVQLWHACGCLKRFGYDTREDIPAGYRGNVFQNTDLVTVSSPCCEAPFASAMRLPGDRVKALGVSRTDRYFDPLWRERARERFAAAYPEAAGKRIALWAPTFRGSPGSPDLIELDIEALERALGANWRVLTSVHPHMRSGGAPLSTEELFVCADCLIADYSSLVFEYLLAARILEDAGEGGNEAKRLVLYTPDFSRYDSRRGFYMDYSEIPGVRAATFPELVRAVGEDAPTGTDGGSLTRQAFLERYMSACDGHATGRILAAMRRERAK